MTPEDPKALQSEVEIAAFAALLAREGVRSYLEIGSKWGGSLWRVARALPKGSRIISVDINVNGESLVSTINRLKDEGYDARLIEGDSMLPATIFQAGLLAPYGAVFIDADHRPPGVWSDWNNYGPMAKIVAFHDIGWRRDSGNPKAKSIAVPEIWNEIKHGYRFEELTMGGKNNGIGVLWR